MRRSAAKEVKPPLQKVKTIYIGDNLDIKQATLQIIAATKDPVIKGIILFVSNGGGSTIGYATLHDTIKNARTFKPVVCITNRACSGGYMIASAADYIIAYDISQIGCIGVITEFTQYKMPRIQNQNGVNADLTVEVFAAGEFKSICSTYHGALSEKERALMQKATNDLYDAFISMIAKDRALNKDNAHDWADAKIFLANEALNLGLIDQIGTMFDAEAKIAELIQTKTYQPYPDYKIQYLFGDDKAA